MNIVMHTKTINLLLLSAVLFAPALGSARILDFNMKSSSVEAQYINRGEFAESFSSGFSAYFNEDNTRYFSIDMQSQLEAVPGSGAIFGIGLGGFIFQQELNTGDTEDDLALGLSILGQGGYRFRLNEIPTQFVLNIGHSPNIINSGEIETLTRANLRTEFHMTPSVIIYLGYRNDTASYTDDSINIEENYDSGAIFGFRVRF